MHFICPVCGLPLAEDGGAARCARGHCFDRAREGYYNLLTGAGGVHGDNRQMVEARREFLDTGAYAFLADAVAAAAKKYTPDGGVLVDAGCGEGYYTDRIARALPESAEVVGFDISKDAVRRAARRNSRLSLAVAGSYHMPFADGSVDTAVNIFSPLCTDETARILCTGGHFILVFPGEEHLYGLKSAIYDTPYRNEPAKTDLPGFSLISDDALTREVTLTSPEKIRALFHMTPYAYRTGAEGRARVEALSSLSTAFAFRLLVYRREPCESTDPV